MSKNLCECGCGEPAKVGNRFIRGHQNKTPQAREAHRICHLGKKQSPELIRKRIEGRAGYKHSEETKRKIGKSNTKVKKFEIRICVAPDCDNKFECEVTSEKRFCCSWHVFMKERVTRVCVASVCNNTFKCLESDPKKFCSRRCASLGRKCSEKTINLMRANSKRNWSNPKYREKTIRAATVAINKKEARERKSMSLKRFWSVKENKECQLKAIFSGCNQRPNNVELVLVKLLDKILHGMYKYTGNGSFIVGGLLPDFVNINGQKKLIEMFGDYWHGTERTGVSNEQHCKERIAHFAEYGYQTLIIWEHELNNLDDVRDKIIEFNRGIQKCQK